MAAVTICSDFGAPKNNVWHLFPMKWWDQMPWSLFSECWALSQRVHICPTYLILKMFSSLTHISTHRKKSRLIRAGSNGMWGDMVESRFNRFWKMCWRFFFLKISGTGQWIILLGILLGKEEKQGRQEERFKSDTEV